MKTGSLVLALIAALIVALLVIGNRAGEIARTTLIRIGSQASGTPWEISSIDISLLRGQGKINDLTIANPQAFYSPYAISIDHGYFDFDLPSFFAEIVIIEDFSLDQAELTYEQSGISKSNLQTILDQVEEFSGDERQPDETDTTMGGFVIERFTFTNGRVVIRSDLFGEKQIEVPDVIVTDLGGQTAEEAIGSVLNATMEPIISEAISAARSEAYEASKEKIKEKVNETLDDLFDDQD